MRDKRVCVRCKIGKTFCDEGRPCRRCIRLGHENDCVDAPSKQPRPRGPGKAKRTHSFGAEWGGIVCVS